MQIYKKDLRLKNAKTLCFRGFLHKTLIEHNNIALLKNQITLSD